MEDCNYSREMAEAANGRFEEVMNGFLREWVEGHQDSALLQFDQPLETYLLNNALRDFFLNTEHALQELLKQQCIASHLGRCAEEVYFDEINGDPLFAPTEQRIYNLARRMDSQRMHVPFRSVHPNKQIETGDLLAISCYPEDSEELRYNSGNHFASRPANTNVFDENSKRCIAKSEGNVHVLFKRGFLEERLHDIKAHTAEMHLAGEDQLQFFVVYSRHSLQEGHFGASLVVMDPTHPDFPKRVMVCDTLLKQLPHHPRWWNYFVEEYSNVFGGAVAELIEDLSHPLQKVNIKGDDPFRHDWDCPYYAASMADALADLAITNPMLLLNGNEAEIHEAMKGVMQDYYHEDLEIKDRTGIQHANRLKRWQSGRELIAELVGDAFRSSSYL